MVVLHSLARATAESQGIPSRAIQDFVDAVEQEELGLHSLMLLRHGRVVAEGWWEPYEQRSPHMLFSLSKSFTSTAVGLLVAEGKLTVDDLVLPFFPDEAPAHPSANLRAMRVRHLLSMSTGHDTEPERDLGPGSAPEQAPPASWTSRFLAHPVVYGPGTHFLYNTAATHVLSAVVQRITGQRLLHYLQPRLFGPLDIENPTWEVLPPGVDAGGFGLSVTTEDIARFGQLYLQKGLWEGTRVVLEAWVEEATKSQVPNARPDTPIDWCQGYGYQFWRCRHGAYRGDGAFGQYCLVMPAQDAVLAITAGTPDMQLVLDRVWQHLLPAMEPASLPEDRAARDALAERLSGLRLPAQAGQRTAEIAASISGKLFALQENEARLETVSLELSGDGAVLVARNQSGEQRIPCGYGTWVRGVSCLFGPEPEKTAATGAWTDGRTFTVQTYLSETPFLHTITFRFEDGQLQVRQHVNVSFGVKESLDLTGHSS